MVLWLLKCCFLWPQQTMAAPIHKYTLSATPQMLSAVATTKHGCPHPQTPSPRPPKCSPPRPQQTTAAPNHRCRQSLSTNATREASGHTFPALYHSQGTSTPSQSLKAFRWHPLPIHHNRVNHLSIKRQNNVFKITKYHLCGCQAAMDI